MIKNLYSVLKSLLTHPLSVNRRLLVLKNFVFWQLGIKFLDKKVIVPWVDDSKILVKKSETGLTGNIYTGFAEYEDMAFIVHALQKSDIFLDIGANAGAYVVLASKVAKAKTICFEPIIDAVERLNDQIFINGISDLVVVRNIGLSNSSGKLFFTKNQDTRNRVLIGHDNHDFVEVSVNKLDDEVDLNSNYFIKLDVEGYEYSVIDGAIKVLSSPNALALIVELNSSCADYGYTNNDIHERILRLDFKPVSYDPISRDLVEIDSYNSSSANTIYVKNIELMKLRCKNSPKRCIHTLNEFYI